MKRKFEFRKNDSEKGRRVWIEIELTADNVFTAHCSGPRIYWGQALDRVEKELNIQNPIFKKIMRFWRLYHLNDMHAGTQKQEKLVKEYNEKYKDYNYDNICEYLAEKHLLYDNGYKYGTGWLKEEIPDNDLVEIRALLAG